MTKKILSIFTISFLFSSTLFGITLKQSILDILNNNPIIQERLKNFRATQQDLTIAESEYYPVIDFRVSAGYTDAGILNTKVNDSAYTSYETSLILTQNIFDGFGTTNKVDYEETRILAAAYNYIEKTNDIVFKMTNAYINVLRSNELLETAKENVAINQTIFNKVNDLFDSGLTTDSEVKKIQSALSLARSNLTVQKNNALDTYYNYRRVLGRLPDTTNMVKPNLQFAMPQSIERAAMYAIKNNPSLIVSRYNVKGVQSLYKQVKKGYYPKIDLEVSQNYNDNDTLNNGFDQADDRFKAKILLSYNIFRGGADNAEIQKNISKIHQELEIKRDLKRQVIEGLDLSWSAYEMIGLQLKDLREYSKFSEKTLELYREEYDLGRRSLLDLLSAQNDVINSRSQIITAEYAQLFAKYRILDAMGILPLSILGDTKELSAKVNLYSDDEIYDILDTLPIKLDVDNDKISDNLDLCDNSLDENNIMPYGCKKSLSIVDAIAIVNPNDTKEEDISLDDDTLDKSLFEDSSDVNESVNVDEDEDGVDDSIDKCLMTPLSHEVDSNGCSVSINLLVNFPSNSSVISKKYFSEIEKVSNFLKDNPQYKILVLGHTNSIGDNDYNLWLSAKRARKIKNKIIANGVVKSRISSDGRGSSEPIIDDNSEKAMRVNRRVEIQLSKID